MNFKQIEQKIAAAFPWDKCAHFIGGHLIFCIALVLGFDLMTCISLVIFVGLLKEAIDPYINDVRDWWDAVATIGGMMPTLLVIVIRGV